MSHATLAAIVVGFIEFLELVDEAHLDPDTAIRQQESIAAHLSVATHEERAAVIDAAKAKLARLLETPDAYGYSPRKALGDEHRQLLENIASGQAFGLSES